MKLLDSTMQFAIPTLGTGVRWLRDELRARGVTVPLTEGPLKALVADADAAARRPLAGLQASQSYISRLREEISERADFVQAWTLSDERAELDGRYPASLVKIARTFALPRAWKLSEMVARPSRRPSPTYLYWASAT